MSQKKILIIEDETSIAELERDYLELSNFQVLTEEDGASGIRRALEEDVDLVILDLMLPEVNGFEVCQQIREFSDVPIIMLTAKGDDMDKILGLEYGADDYITKPFNILEVKARIKAIIRRTGKEEADKKVMVFGDLKLNQEYRRVFVNEREINVTGREYELLEFLASSPGKTYSREALLEMVWGKDFPGDERTVDVHIRRLREKLENNPSDPRYVRTKWGEGYYFQA